MARRVVSRYQSGGDIFRKEISLKPEEIANLSTKQIQRLLGQANRTKDVMGGTGQLRTKYNKIVKEFNKKYETEYEVLKAPSKKDLFYREKLIEQYQTIQSFMLSRQSSKTWYEDVEPQIQKMTQEIEKMKTEHVEKMLEAIEDEETKELIKNREHRRKLDKYYEEESEIDRNALVEDSLKYWQILKNRLRGLEPKATASEIAAAANKTVEDHPLITPEYSFEQLVKDAHEELKRIMAEDTKNGLERTRQIRK